VPEKGALYLIGAEFTAESAAANSTLARAALILNRMQIVRWVTLALLLSAAVPFAIAGSSSNLDREKNWADQIMDSLIAGEAVWLQAYNVKFLGLYTAPAPDLQSKRGIILLHGRGVHPGWGFIDNLRVDLADGGWHTLSLQMPILNPDIAFAEYRHTFPEAFARIDAGMQYLAQRGVRRVFVIGHSTGAMISLAYVAERPAAPIAGIVAVGTSNDTDGGAYMQPAEMLAKITKPVLDIYGGNDSPIVLETAANRRAAAAKANNRGYVQERISGADHFFTAHYDALAAAINAWLGKRAGR